MVEKLKKEGGCMSDTAKIVNVNETVIQVKDLKYLIGKDGGRRLFMIYWEDAGSNMMELKVITTQTDGEDLKNKLAKGMIYISYAHYQAVNNLG